MKTFVIRFKEKQNWGITTLTYKAQTEEEAMKKFKKVYTKYFKFLSIHCQEDVERRLNIKFGIPSIVEILD